MASFGHDATPRIAGLVTWLAAGVPLALAAPHEFSGALAVAATAYLLFGAAFVATARDAGRPGCSPARLGLLVLQSLCALAIASVIRSGLEGVFLVIVAAQLVFVLPLGVGVAWTAAQTLVYGLLITSRASLVAAAVQTTAYLGFSAFAVYAGWIAEREGRQRQELSLLYAELQSTQALLAESSRLAERTRIARDLHDLLGHHLTALSLSLEVAAHVSEGRAREEVERARAISKLLLSDLRGVVSEFREGEALDLRAALCALASAIPRPEIVLDVAPDVAVTDPGLAETLLRCAQELATNAARHSGARRLTLSLARHDERLTLTADDDGRGAADLRQGNGLIGMRERVKERGGTLTVTTARDRGFRVVLEVPA